MKKIIKIAILVILVIVVASLLLINSNDYVDVVKSTLENTTRVKIYNYQTKEAVAIYTDRDTEDFIKDLDYSLWTETKELNDKEIAYILKLYDGDDYLGDLEIYSNMEYIKIIINEEEKLYQTNHSLKKLFKNIKK